MKKQEQTAKEELERARKGSGNSKEKPLVLGSDSEEESMEVDGEKPARKTVTPEDAELTDFHLFGVLLGRVVEHDILLVL